VTHRSLYLQKSHLRDCDVCGTQMHSQSMLSLWNNAIAAPSRWLHERSFPFTRYHACKSFFCFPVT